LGTLSPKDIAHVLQMDGFEGKLVQEPSFNIAEERRDAPSQRVQARLSIKAAA
jgi:hypothetical protein